MDESELTELVLIEDLLEELWLLKLDAELVEIDD
jgi:hypothetical protein